MERKRSEIIKELTEIIPVFNTTGVHIATLYIGLEKDKNNELLKQLIAENVDLFNMLKARKESLEDELDRL